MLRDHTPYYTQNIISLYVQILRSKCPKHRRNIYEGKKQRVLTCEIQHKTGSKCWHQPPYITAIILEHMLCFDINSVKPYIFLTSVRNDRHWITFSTVSAHRCIFVVEPTSTKETEFCVLTCISSGKNTSITIYTSYNRYSVFKWIIRVLINFT